eukprot:8255222-Prorocentrum_lima.AAC.1
MDFWDIWLDSSGLNCQYLIWTVRGTQQEKDEGPREEALPAFGPWEEALPAFGISLNQKLC